MRIIADCASCSSVVVPGGGLSLVQLSDGTFLAEFECPVCGQDQSIAVARVAAPALVARGAKLVAWNRPPALSAGDLAAFKRLLADDEACRRQLNELR